ncbi:MAG TPA: trypsin-like peptidase domain-containing protein [Pseudomonadales bacterium]|nr:trypsin-like peptidase domain-containing protein [Pseudomonadales bacterium]
MRRWLVLLSGLLVVNISLAQDVRNAVVQIFNQGHDVNFQYPWQNGDMVSGSGTGVIIAGNRILTNAHVVDNSLLLQVRKVGSDKKFTAEVAFMSDERDLALVTVKDPEFFRGTEAMSLGALPLLGDEVTTYGFPVGGTQLAITRGVVSRIDYDVYAHSGYPNLICQVDAAINPGASGGPAIVNGHLAGLNFQGLPSAKAANVGYIIPPPVIESFLKDIADGKVDGVPEIAVVTQSTENPQLRQRYALAEQDGGVLITSLSGLEKEKGLFKEGDVVVSIDGQSIGNDSTVRFATADRIDMNILIARRQLGESLPISVIREGKKVDISYPLTYSLKDARILLGHQSNFVPDYEVVGGLVVVEVNQDMMRGWKYIPPAVDIQRFEYRKTGAAVEDRLLMVINILPDEMNIGYEYLQFSIIGKVNNIPVSNLQQLREQMKKVDSEYLALGFVPHNSQVLFSRKVLAERTPIITERYKVKPSVKSPPAASAEIPSAAATTQ